MQAVADILMQPQAVARGVSIALLVVLATQAIRWFGPAVGGLIASMPMITGPAYFILLAQGDIGFTAEAAAYSLIYIGAAQVFLLVFIATLRRIPPAVAFLLAGLARFGAILVLGLLPPWPRLGLAGFVVITVLTRRLARRFVRITGVTVTADRAWITAIKGASAGVLVAFSTSVAASIGTSWSGVLLVFPIAFVVLCATALKIYGKDVLIATLYSAMRGSSSLAAFCFVLAAGLRVLSPWSAFAAAVCAAVGTTLALGWLMPRRGAGPDG
ncbi:hypothetical protein MASR1M32_03130 [Rhodobacter sp.]